MVPLTAFLIGPIGVYVGAWLAAGLGWVNGLSPFIFALLTILYFSQSMELDEHH